MSSSIPRAGLAAPSKKDASVSPLAWDSETDLIRPAHLAPPLACVTWQRPGDKAAIVAGDCRGTFRSWFADPATLHIGANVAYDMGVAGQEYPELLPAIFDAYDGGAIHDAAGQLIGIGRVHDGRVTDVQIRQRLLDIAGGVYLGRYGEKGVYIKHTYDLEALARRCAGMVLQKDEWRLSYGKFRGVPLHKWPERAAEVQADARVRLADLETEWAGAKAADVPDEVKHTIEGIKSMLAGDPWRCVEYPLDDARATLAVWQAQEKHASYLQDQYRQARGAFWLHLCSAWGIRIDPTRLEDFRAEIKAEREEKEQELILSGLMRADGSRDTKRAKALMVEVCAREGAPIRRTDGHAEKDPEKSKCRDAAGNALPPGDDRCVEHVSLDADACNSTDDDLLGAYAEVVTLKKLESNELTSFANGTVYPIHSRFGLAETGRTTSSNPPIQNLAKREGVRELIIPRPGNWFAQCDYPTLELYALAQCCVTWLGQSELAKMLLGGIDPHLKVAAQILGITYDAAKANVKRSDVKQARQLAKAANFGWPGGMGDRKFLASLRKALGKDSYDALYPTFLALASGLADCTSKPREDIYLLGAKSLRTAWYAALPEMPYYFARVNALTANESGRASVETVFTRRHRGGATYCAACNTGFQGLGADIAKHAGWLIARAEYVERSSPLFNCRTIAFVHDEFIVEVPANDVAHDAAVELGRLMSVGANTLLPDVPIAASKMDPLLMTRWSKGAEAVRGTDGRLVPWTGEEKAAA